jgi:hypothetical protein
MGLLPAKRGEWIEQDGTLVTLALDGSGKAAFLNSIASSLCFLPANNARRVTWSCPDRTGMADEHVEGKGGPACWHCRNGPQSFFPAECETARWLYVCRSAVCCDPLPHPLARRGSFCKLCFLARQDVTSLSVNSSIIVMLRPGWLDPALLRTTGGSSWEWWNRECAAQRSRVPDRRQPTCRGSPGSWPRTSRLAAVWP